MAEIKHKTLNFHKIQATGNDFIALPADPELTYSELAFELCNRKRGIGADGLLVYYKECDKWHLKIFNSDGSKAQICGNALRAFVMLTEKLEPKISNANEPLWKTIVTDAAECKGRVLSSYTSEILMPVPVMSEKITISDEDSADIEIYPVNAGVPHAVIIEKNCSSDRLNKLFKKVAPHFSDGINLDVIRDYSDNSVDALVWERGVGPTDACGTGACSIFKTVSYLYNLTTPLKVKFPGGILTVRNEGDKLALAGEASVVFKGQCNNHVKASSDKSSPRIRAAIVIVREDKVLLVEHSKNNHKYWLLPGGGVHNGELARNAAERELLEETNMHAEAGRFMFSAETIDPVTNRHIYHVFFEAENPRGEPSRGIDERVVGAQFVSIDKLKYIDLRPRIGDELLKAISVSSMDHYHPEWVVQERS